jgi:2,4-dienoyl-CoA reductase-like NADH-dependent reductase (Old Yellow Enzyme family)
MILPCYTQLRYLSAWCALFQPLTSGALTLPNRILLAPLTRSRADAGHVPNDLMAHYYAQRAED